jgi:hypothetical protein
MAAKKVSGTRLLAKTPVCLRMSTTTGPHCESPAYPRRASKLLHGQARWNKRADCVRGNRPVGKQYAVDHSPQFGQLPYTRNEDICRRCPQRRQAWPWPFMACQQVSTTTAAVKIPATPLRRMTSELFAASMPPARLVTVASTSAAIPRQPNVSNRSCFIWTRAMQAYDRRHQGRLRAPRPSLRDSR